MKITLEFDDVSEAQEAIDGGKWLSVCLDFDQWLRGQIKHGTFEIESDQEVFDKVRMRFCEMIAERNLTFE